MSQAMQLVFTKVKETKNTYRFEERDLPEGTEAAIGVLYVQKSALTKLGNPDKLIVTVEGR